MRPLTPQMVERLRQLYVATLNKDKNENGSVDMHLWRAAPDRFLEKRGLIAIGRIARTRAGKKHDIVVSAEALELGRKALVRSDLEKARIRLEAYRQKIEALETEIAEMEKDVEDAEWTGSRSSSTS